MKIIWVDPLANRHPSLNEYNYAENNPITLVDVWGTQGIPYSAAGYVKNEINKVVKVAEASVVQMAENAEKMIQNLKQAATQPIIDNAQGIIETCDKLEKVCNATKDAALLTTVASGGATGEVTLPLAAVAGAGEFTMQAMKGAINYIVDDEAGKREGIKNTITETAENVLTISISKIPYAKQAKAVATYL